MSIYIDQNNEINRYYLEIEKFLPQLIENPYVGEVKNDIYMRKINLLKKHTNNIYANYIDNLTLNTINIIFNKLYDIKNFHILNSIFNEIMTHKIRHINKYIVHYIQEPLFKLKLHNHILQPTPIKISTMTVCCYLDQLIDIKLIYDTFIPPFDIHTDNFNQVSNKLNMYDIIGCKNSNQQKG